MSVRTVRKTVRAYVLAIDYRNRKTQYWPEALPRVTAIAAAKHYNREKEDENSRAFVVGLELSTDSIFWNDKIVYPPSAKGKTLLTVGPSRKWESRRSGKPTNPKAKRTRKGVA